MDILHREIISDPNAYLKATVKLVSPEMASLQITCLRARLYSETLKYLRKIVCCYLGISSKFIRLKLTTVISTAKRCLLISDLATGHLT